MKKILLIILAVQVILLAIGIYQIHEGDIFVGLFNIIVNGFFIPYNIRNCICD